ncbi:MAG TPA: hypothetical protein VFM24_02030 [Nitrospira sp.]|nr:hypothetical protein [Nitrospira sp.]
MKRFNAWGLISRQEANVTGSKRAIHVILIGCANIGASAYAGELGPRSRDTISISVTIPPHVTVAPAAEVSAEGSTAPNALCIGAAGLRDYRLAIVDPAGFAEDGGVQFHPASCSDLGKQAAGLSGSGPITVLVIPD